VDRIIAALLLTLNFHPVSLLDKTVGVGQFMQLILKYWEKYDFFKCSSFEKELEKQGFNADFDMPCYLFREDGKRIWEAYGKFARNFVDEVYENDQAVKDNAHLQEWANETTVRASMKGFPKSFDDKKTLADTLQTLGWISCNHAAVNYPQYDVSFSEVH
jgi:arachidonate 15-lipoxygenase